MSNTISDDTRELPDVEVRANVQLAATQAHDLASQGFNVSLFRSLALIGALIANTFSLNAIWLAFLLQQCRCAYPAWHWASICLRCCGVASRKAGAGRAAARKTCAMAHRFHKLRHGRTSRRREADRLERWTGSAFFAGRSLLSRIGARPLRVIGLSLFACLIVYAGWALKVDGKVIGTSAFLIIAACLVFAFSLAL